MYSMMQICALQYTTVCFVVSTAGKKKIISIALFILVAYIRKWVSMPQIKLDAITKRIKQTINYCTQYILLLFHSTRNTNSKIKMDKKSIFSPLFFCVCVCCCYDFFSSHFIFFSPAHFCQFESKKKEFPTNGARVVGANALCALFCCKLQSI